jgi:signal transduction histidine kinase
MVIRDEAIDLPPSIQKIDPWLFAAALPIISKDWFKKTIVGVILVGDKGGGTPLHDKDLEALSEWAKGISEQLTPVIKLNKFRLRVSNTIHDVGNLFRSIVIKFDLAMPLDETDHHNIQKAVKMLQDLRTLALEELNAGKKEDKRMSPVAIEPLLNELMQTYQTVAEQKGLKIILKTDSPLPRPCLDALMIDRVIGNVVSNAVKYTTHGNIHITGMKEDGYVVITVTDTGLGIPKDSLSRIFECGYRVPGKAAAIAEGTGVGLSNVKELILAMGGRIEVTSEFGKGSTFIMWFPVPPEEEARAKAA